jgi:DedD protein
MRDPVYGGTNREGAQERRRLIIRAGVAGALVVALLAALLIFGQDKGVSQQDSEVAGTRPEIGIAVNSSAPTIPADIQKAITEAPDTAQAALASAPVDKESVTKAPESVVEEGSKDPSVKPILNPTPPVKVVSGHPAKETHADRLLVESGHTVPALAPATPPPPPSPPPIAVPSQIITVTPTPALPSGSFAVQLGVFSNVGNAQELQTKLKQAGIPAQLETRVQVGPFANREEAVRAQDKLRSLGLGKGMLVVAGKKL